VLNIICTIMVTLPLDNGGGWSYMEQVRGHMIKNGEYNYIVDFSREAKRLGFKGDYSFKMVPKRDCEHF
jgi:hypothetical protein